MYPVSITLASFTDPAAVNKRNDLSKDSNVTTDEVNNLKQQLMYMKEQVFYQCLYPLWPKPLPLLRMKCLMFLFYASARIVYKCSISTCIRDQKNLCLARSKTRSDWR